MNFVQPNPRRYSFAAPCNPHASDHTAKILSLLVWLLCLITALAAPPAAAQPGPDGYDFVRIGATNNPAYNVPDPYNMVGGRGSVPYEYGIGRTEVTSAHWLEFFNAALARPDPLPFSVQHWWARPLFWGGSVDPTYTGPGTRYRLRTDVLTPA